MLSIIFKNNLMENILVCAWFRISRINEKKFKGCFDSFRSKQFLEKLTESTIYKITCVNNIKFILLIFVIADAGIAQFSSFVLKIVYLQ